MSMAYAVYLRVYSLILGGGQITGKDASSLHVQDEIAAMALGAHSARVSLATCGNSYGPIGPMTAHELQAAIVRLHGTGAPAVDGVKS